MGIFRTQDGRLRTGWRISLFVLLFPVFFIPASALPLEGLNWQALPVLLASLMAGALLLALDGRRPGALGFYLTPRVPAEMGLGLVVGLAVALLTVLGIFSLGGIRYLGEGGDLPSYLREGGRSLWFFTLPAAAEEALFRGYLLQALAEAWGALRALWFTSLAFGFIHMTNPNTSVLGLVNIVVAGLFLGVVYLKTASLWWATGAHLGWNWALGFLADGPVSGLDLVDAPGYRLLSTGPEWLSGGAFGAEGSLLATGFLGAGAVVIWKTRAVKPGRDAIDVRPLVLSIPGIQPEEGGEGNMEMNDTWRAT